MKLSRLFRTALLCACTFTLYGVQATVDKVELDGNAVKETALDDWQNINLSTSMANVTTGVIADLPPQTIFWKGGSKDTLDVTEWWYRDGAVPDKDDLRNGYASAYFIDNGAGGNDLVFYFGAERYANNGDAIMGFWFFQDKVGPGANNQFTGQHQENDLFIIMEYPQGSNSVPYVQVMRWVNAGGSVSEHLDLLYASGASGAKCGTAGDSGIACAITNEQVELAGTVNGLWPYDNKEGTLNVYAIESLFEGRLNVSQAFMAAGISEIPCFSSFLIETRSSRSETAQLKDFLGGNFPLCSIAISKTCGATELTADNKFRIDYTLSLTNTGIGSIGAVETVTVDDAPSDAAPFMVTQGVSMFANGADGWAPNEVLTYNGYYISDVNGGTNTVDASVSFGAASIVADQYTATCDSLALSPMLTIHKNCSLSLEATNGVVALRKDYDVTVCNTGDAPLNVSLTDSVDPNLQAMFSLDFPKMCLTNADCGAGYSCDGNQFCVNNGGMQEGNFGGNVCNVTTGDYLPATLPNGTSGSLANTATAKATSPVVDTGELATIGNSSTANCDLCPLTPPQD
ncbi:hypothetical protein [Shewanella dokdonensis]|uniref:DUF11 domain-containing protein n=1 Tax=Shewanella dokdonensis TaxID=712036 RepID=A0ABX8DFU8_9GAMM|nr:hypothetical protein [Shewanella dokdonensis]MCL1075139.1 hypothetical protein [Shewanella dokdonensis]QVK23535.1 hypothetical protein KHX94_01840 [Shewanella dokdonensis]